MKASVIHSSVSRSRGRERSGTMASALRTAFMIAGVIAVLAYLLGMAVALYQNVGGTAEGGPARDTWLTIGTVYSPPLGFVILYVVFLGLASRRSRAGVVGIVGVMVLSAMSDLSVPGDWHSTADAIAHHFNPLGVLAVGVILVINVAVVLLGGLVLWTGRTARGAHRDEAPSTVSR